MAEGSYDATVGQRVDDGVGRVPGFVNSYVVGEAGRYYLIDTGFSSRASRIRRAFERAGVPLSSITAMILTHYHVDHIRGASRLETLRHAPIACHSADAPVVEGRSPIPGSVWVRLFARTHPIPVRSALGEGESIGPFQVVHVPGHTPGSIALYHPQRRMMFSGDAVIEREGRVSLAASRYAWNFPQAIASLDHLRARSVELLLPGHGEPVRGDIGRRLTELRARYTSSSKP